jgi:glycosyltransferase involved in cell wall biosynthesis
MTKSDSTPSSLLEAMASGLPAVCADAASIDEWLGAGDGGEIVPQLDEVALAASLARLLADPARRAEYGERNREFVRTRVHEAGPLLEELYRQVIGTEKPAGATPRAAGRLSLGGVHPVS